MKVFSLITKIMSPQDNQLTQQKGAHHHESYSRQNDDVMEK